MLIVFCHVFLLLFGCIVLNLFNVCHICFHSVVLSHVMLFCHVMSSVIVFPSLPLFPSLSLLPHAFFI